MSFGLLGLRSNKDRERTIEREAEGEEGHKGVLVWSTSGGAASGAGERCQSEVEGGRGLREERG